MSETMDADGERGWRRRHWVPTGLGILFAAIFFVASLTPSLIPRDPVMQGALSGISAAVGYAVGSLVVWVWRIMLLPLPGPSGERAVRSLLVLVALGLCGWGLWNAAEWQNATRAVMQLEPVSTGHPVVVGGIALAIFLVLWAAGSGFMFLARRAGGTLGRVLPGRVGPVLGVLVAVFISWTLVNGVLVRKGLALADDAFAAGEQVFDPATEQPTDPIMTGSEASLIGWDELGNRGRDFISRTPAAEEIADYWGDGAKRPVRVYVGRVSADTARERAELALQELIRTGGFERELLIITTPVGTGWMDPGAHDTIDFMWGGDTAQVGAQYSYLTSVLSILTNVEYGLDQARALFDVIYGHWLTLPEEERPDLYIHGLSQGALNSQAEFPLFDVLAAPPKGAMWAGSPFVSPLWSYVRSNRNPDSPAWRPTFGNGSMIRVTNQENVLDVAPAPWGPIRFVFLSYGSDPIVNFDFATLWRRPAWLEAPRAPDVSPEMRWFPLVTAFQVGLDMTIALAVEGYGHFYVAEDYIDAWAALTDPPGWSEARAEELKAIFEARPPPW